MLKYEIKKIFLKPVNRIVLMVLAAIVLIGSFLAIRDVKYYRGENHSALSGISAARQLKKEKNQWKGYITEESIMRVVEENKTINSSSDSPDNALALRQGFDDIRHLINLGFSETGNYDYYLCDNISPGEAAGLYERRISKLKEELSASKDTKTTDFLINQYQKLKTPLYYEYMEGWKALLDSQYLPTLMIITIVIIGFLVSGIFSNEFHLKADSIFFSTEFGRNKAVSAKIKAGFLIITVVYWSVMLLFSAIILGVLGFDGAGCMIQAGENWSSLYNITYLQSWLLTMFGGYIGNLFILMLAMFISVISRSTVIAITIPFALSCAPMFLGRIPLFTDIMNLFPDMLLRMCAFLDDLTVYEIGGKVFGVYAILIPVYLLLSFVVVPLLYCSYKKAEVK
ncbi:MAG: ABC transporter permease [Lachnospiraceae bacterium]|nr:ABC transporter permease [Lachnospiraceae bacterium]